MFLRFSGLRNECERVSGVVDTTISVLTCMFIPPHILLQKGLANQGVGWYLIILLKINSRAGLICFSFLSPHFSSATVSLASETQIKGACRSFSLDG